MEIYIKVIGAITELVERAHINTKTELFIMDNGNKIFNMAKEYKHGKMDQNMKDSITMEESRDLEFTPGKMDRNMKDSGN